MCLSLVSALVRRRLLCHRADEMVTAAKIERAVIERTFETDSPPAPRSKSPSGRAVPRACEASLDNRRASPGPRLLKNRTRPRDETAVVRPMTQRSRTAGVAERTIIEQHEAS